MSAKLDLDLYQKAYFYFDLPVEYKIKDKILLIYPITVRDSEIFLSSMSVIGIDKNSSDSVEIIQMSYLSFVYKVLFQDSMNVSRFINILKYCLHIESPNIGFNESDKPYIKTEDGIMINDKDFENIRRIILYQNIIHYDDEYINPEMKKMMEEVDAVKNAGLDSPSVERRMAIITAHCGISKQEQMAMSYRSHSLLFEEVYGEVEFTTIRPIMLYAGKGNEIDHWIFKKKRNKFDGYIASAEKYANSMGSDKNAIKNSFDSMSDNLLKQYENFIK